MQKSSTSFISPAYAGVAFLFSWIYLVFYASTAGIEAAAPISLMSSSYMLSTLSLIATSLAIAFLPFKRQAFLLNSATKIATAATMGAGTVVLIYGSFFEYLPLITIGGIITGITSGILGMQWVYVYKRVSIKMAICSFPTLMAISVCTCLTLMYLPRNVMLGCAVVMPIISELMFHWVRLDLLPKHEIETGPQNKPANFLMVLIPICLFYLASGFLDFYSKDSVYTYVFYALAAFIPLVIALAFIYIADRKGIVGAAVVPACFLVVAFVPMLSLHGYLPAAQFISIGELGLEVVVFIAAVAFSEFFDLGSLKVYALARSGMVLFSSAGWYIAEAVDKTASSLAYYQLSLVVAFIGIEALTICLIVSIVKARKSVKAGEARTEGEEPSGSAEQPTAESPAQPAPLAPAPEPSESPEERFQRRCMEICEQYELSKRELDVLQLLARGYSAARIQQELYIAAGTVNYHTRNVYSKLGVHSKQEVIDLVGRDS